MESVIHWFVYIIKFCCTVFLLAFSSCTASSLRKQVIGLRAVPWLCRRGESSINPQMEGGWSDVGTQQFVLVVVIGTNPRMTLLAAILKARRGWLLKLGMNNRLDLAGNFD